MSPLRTLFATSLSLAAACGGSSDAPDSPTTADAGPITGDTIGSFALQLVAPTADGAGYTALLGKVYDGVQPQAIQWVTVQTVGACTLSTPHVPFCATACGSSAVCVADDTCEPYAAAQDVGTVHASGIATSTGATEFDMEPIVHAYQPTGLTLKYPAPFAEGAAISLAAAGSSFTPAFALHGTGIAELSLANPSPIALQRDTAVALAWNAPSVASHVHVKLDVSHHGGTKGMIECDADDTGALSIDGALLTKLLDLGAAGYPTIIVTRSTTGSANVTGGHVDLVVSSEVERAVTVPGVTSCTSDDMCPQGETCGTDQTCQ